MHEAQTVLPQEQPYPTLFSELLLLAILIAIFAIKYTECVRSATRGLSRQKK